MEEPIKQILFKELKERNISLKDFCESTGINYERAKNWSKKSNASPKDSGDIEKIKAWLNKGNTTPSSGNITMAAEDRIAELANDKKVLQDVIASSLSMIQGAQQLLQQTMTENHTVILHVLAGYQTQLVGKMDDLEKIVSAKGKN